MTQMTTDPQLTNSVPTSNEPPTFVVEPPRGGLHGWSDRLREAFAARELLFFLAWKDITVRYKQTAIGVLWAIVQPLLTVGVFSIFFGSLGKMAHDGSSYALATMAGLLPWQLFAHTVFAGSQSLVMNQTLIRKVYFPRLLIPMSPMAVAVVDFLIAMGLLFIWIAFSHTNLSANVWGLIPSLLLAMATAFGTALWLAALNVKFRDIQVVVPFLIQIWMFCTPVAYSSSIVPPSLRRLYAINPMVTVVDGFRASLFGSPNLDSISVTISVVVAAILAISGLMFFWSTEDTFADIV